MATECRAVDEKPNAFFECGATWWAEWKLAQSAFGDHCRLVGQRELIQRRSGALAGMIRL
jgi:hypothetical protein